MYIGGRRNFGRWSFVGLFTQYAWVSIITDPPESNRRISRVDLITRDCAETPPGHNTKLSLSARARSWTPPSGPNEAPIGALGGRTDFSGAPQWDPPSQCGAHGISPAYHFWMCYRRNISAHQSIIVETMGKYGDILGVGRIYMYDMKNIRPTD